MPDPKPYHRTMEIRDFTCFHKANFKFGPGVNVFVGENGTGKTHVLKLLYILQTGQFGDANLHDAFPKVFNVPSATKIIRAAHSLSQIDGMFGETEWSVILEDVSSEERRRQIADQITHQRTNLSASDEEDFKSRFLDSDAKRFLVSAFTDVKWRDVGRPVFIPTQDILGHFRRFVSLYDTYKIDFDSTYRDLATLLQAPEKRELSAYQEEMLALIRKLVGGEFAFKGEGFVLDHGQGEHEAALIAEGHRKLGALALLIRNGMLEPGNTLFWDEPEANVNPTAMDELVTVLLTLSRHGVQIFLSTHSYVILKEFDLQATTEDGVRYFAFGKSDEGTQVQSSTDFTALSPNPILDQYDSLFARGRREVAPGNRSVSVVEESGIEFDFTNATALALHDVALPTGDGNKTWPGIDFRVDEGSRELWIEVKSWHANRFKTTAERIEADKEFSKVLTTEEFRVWIVSKFLGTTSYLTWTGAFNPKPIVYVVLLDSSRRDRSALLGPFKDRLRPSFPKTSPWTHPIRYLVLDLETFQALFASYPCHRI